MIKTLSLFTGAGGLDIGFHNAGFTVVACNEINTAYCRTLEANKSRYFPRNCQVINEDIRVLDPRKIGTDRCDFIIGGPPCQSFSAAGRRAGGVSGIKDTRGSLFEHYCRYIEHFRPRGFLFENVRGILSSNRQEDWKVILSAFSQLGYQVYYRILDATDYGVPQHRERLILVGVEKTRDFLFPRPTHGPDSHDNLPYVTPLDAIRDLQDENELMDDYDGKYGALLKEIPPGMNYLYFTKEMGYPNPIFAWRSRFSDFLYKADPNKPVKTIVARLGKFSGPFHWKNRRFTLAEYRRLFTFPDDYVLVGGLNKCLEQIGNSVAPSFAYELALAVKKQIFDARLNIELLPSSARLSFDQRKKEKAHLTKQARRRNQRKELPLFLEDAGVIAPRTSSSRTYYCYYPNWKKRICRSSENPPLNGARIKIEEHLQSDEMRIVVSRFAKEKYFSRPIVRYELKFHSAIGTGLEKIVCSLCTNNHEDVVAAWDAIEQCVTEYSNYHSLVDIFGHFTEPHPIFDLDLCILTKKKSFILRFIDFFSKFDKVAVNYPLSLVESFMDESDGRSSIDVVKWLRSLRFDIRVYETNRTIQQGFFRCCYPFTVHVDKQVSVTWTDCEDGNSRRGLVKQGAE